jgi:flagellar motor switch protein FliG
MTILIIGMSFILIWFGTTFFILRYINILKDDLLKKFFDTEKQSKGDEKKEGRPFDYIKGYNPKDLLNFIQQEHPQVIALVLAYLEPVKASVILQNLPHDLQSDISRRIATLDRVSPEITREIERVLEKKLSMLPGESSFTAGGVDSIVEILNHVDCDSKDQIIKEFKEKDPELAKMIKNSHHSITT